MRLRRDPLPSAVRDELALQRRERVLAAAPTRGGNHVTATNTALHLPTTGGYTRIPWERVDHATWKDGLLYVRETGAGTEHHIRLTEPGSVPETVRERVTATVALTHHAELPGGAKVRIAARRPAAGGDVRWNFVFEPGLDPDDPGLRAQAERVLDDLRRQTGL